MDIGIVTATFNRVDSLKRLYNSLIKQTNKEFSWIVVDDGSTDDTENYIKSLESDIKVYYIKQRNGGKSRALNSVFNYRKKFDLYVVVDSDDYLMSKAIETISKKATKYKKDLEIGAIFFRYNDQNGNLLTRDETNDKDELKLSRIEHDSRYQKADGCISYYRRSIEEYQYPEFDGETYVGPTVIQLMMSSKYKILFTQDVVGIAEYQQHGLTNSGRKLRMNNPYGMLIYCHYMQDKEFNYFDRIKYGIMANAYYYLGLNNKKINQAKISEKISIPVLLRPFGIFLAKIWKKKYMT